MINLGLIIMSIGVHVFLIAANLATGGLTGLSMIIHELVPNLSIPTIVLIGNIILFITAFILIGRDFGGYTIYASLAFSGMLALLERFWPQEAPLTDDLLLNLIFGTLLPAMGMAIIFFQNASTGGTDILAKILNKYTHVDIGKALLIVDVFIVIFAAGTFGIRPGLYALIGVIMNGMVIDNVIAGLSNKLAITVISKEVDTINAFILKELDRGTTLFHADGGFSGNDHRVLYTIVSKRQYIRIKKFVQAIDPDALVTLSFVNEVIGEGFKGFESWRVSLVETAML